MELLIIVCLTLKFMLRIFLASNHWNVAVLAIVVVHYSIWCLVFDSLVVMFAEFLLTLIAEGAPGFARMKSRFPYKRAI